MEAIEGKIAIIFGAAGGMSIEINRTLLKNGIRNLILSDVHDASAEIEAIQEENSNVYYEKGDVSNKNFVSSIFKKYSELLGCIDIVINCAAILDENRIELTQQINVLGTIYTTYEAFEHMGKHRGGNGGVVVNIGSIAGLGTSLKFMPVYCSTKHAVVGFCRCLMDDIFHDMMGVKIVVICPGITVTPMVQNTGERLTNFPELKEKSLELLDAHPIQGVDKIAETLLMALEDNDHGIWKVENSIITKITDMKNY